MSIRENNSDFKKNGKRANHFKWSHFSYATRLTVSFAAIAAMTAMVTIGILSFVWEQHFQAYTADNVQIVADATADKIAGQYRKSRAWTDAVLAPARYATEYTPGLGLQVIDANTQRVVYDSTVAVLGSDNNGLSLAPPFTAQSEQSKIYVDGQVIGSVRVWVYGSDTLLRQTDELFRENSYQAMVIATLVAILMASCIGFLFARNFVNPIKCMTKMAQAIKEGDLSARTNLKGDDEIARLAETFDAMAESVEKDRELERRLTTDVAHELRTPLMALQSTVEAMIDGVFEADIERLDTVNAEVQRLSRLVDVLLKLSRLESRSTPIDEKIVNVGELIAGIIAAHEAFVIDSGLTMDFETDEDVLVLGDADMIKQATANLISNAVRYTPEGGHIGVRVKRGDIMASIMVKDTGIGLSPDEAKMVFSRFWRADAGRTRESGGLGVGLAVVKEIVDRHGGWVRVEGKPDHGATFTIYIPLYFPDSEKVKKSPRTPRKK